MNPSFNLDDLTTLKIRIDEKAFDLFLAKAETPQLYVSRYNIKQREEIVEEELNKIDGIWDVSQIQALRDLGDSSQAFFIRQDRSWTTLNTSRELFQQLLDTYNIFPPFWKFVFTFGRKSEENEFEFPGFKSRCTRSKWPCRKIFIESAYMLRRVELNHREGQSPWSIRQTAVYHRLEIDLDTNCSLENDKSSLSTSKSIFLLIAPPGHLEQQLVQFLQPNGQEKQAISIWNAHRMLIVDSLKNWMEYMSYLEEQLKEQSDHIVLAKVGPEKENLSPLTDFNINFVDRQTLKILEDSVIDLQIILGTALNTIIRIGEHCKTCHTKYSLPSQDDDSFQQIMDEFDEYCREAEMNVERAKLLRDRATSTAQLLSDLLSYEEAVALKDLAKESHEEGKEMHRLTERSTKDAAAVKTLTVITLVYLPTTIVANFFSTQFVQTNESGHMRLSNNVWLLAAIAIPLTIVTIAFWAIWVHFTKITPLPSFPGQPSTPDILRQGSFRSILTWKKKSKMQSHSSLFSSPKARRLSDIEVGSQTATRTWSSKAMTVKPN